ncbi:MAG: hypothetical protein US58_C0007G0023 [Candidatus Magasanikbacteria bacterium GW2011_GWA2_37_8]|uniref:Rubrerythrin diiron-binding domain-containing protein n=1 Tax=Candidatus Magasanikbacteria bacterium GW2011_GWA2_37_8 TaxID=1619036 RepID=A0A0G0HFM8_9BACT|nr:MAG: hypothetical protein US58_C0007G0023 [Candidatus Magasanikbacteria bacterium GW2011_GWA2_37_8]
MLNKKDFLEFCDQLMAIEIEMEHESIELMRHIDNEEAVNILQKIASDERRHEKIVREIKKIINKHYV